MLELHSYITIGNPWPVRDRTAISLEEMYNRYVVPVAQKDFTLVQHFKPYTPWHLLLQDRARMVYDSVKNSTQPVVWCDTDVFFIKPCADRIMELIEDYDMLASDSGDGGICNGFMVYAPTNKTIEFLDKVANDQYAYDRAQGCDQEATNRFCDMLNWKHLPKDEFFSTAYWIGPVPIEGWKPTGLPIPSEVRTIHSTSIFAPEKVAILEELKDMIYGGTL